MEETSHPLPEDASKASALPPWLERSSGEIYAIVGSVTLGRSVENTVCIPTDNVSRFHALVQARGTDSHAIVDLGSRNGTIVNGRRINSAVELEDGDKIQIGDETLVFHVLGRRSAREAAPREGATIMQMRSVDAFLLVGDLTGFSEIARSLEASALSNLVGQWIGRCNAIVEAHGGAIDKYLGDGFLAYWDAKKSTAEAVSSAVDELRAMQATLEVNFRIVLHAGPIFMGAGLARNEEILPGPSVNFVFRMEKLAGELALDFCLSEPAKERLERHLETESVPGLHPLKGFPDEYRFFHAGQG